MKSLSPILQSFFAGILLIGIILSAGCTTSPGSSAVQGTQTPVIPVKAQVSDTTTPVAQTSTAANCRSDQTSCNAFCRNLDTDSTNCGQCGVTCTAGSTCLNGKCTATVTTTAAPAMSWTGTWTTQPYGPLALTQAGNHVSGSYAYGTTTGTLSGTVSGGGYIISGTWYEDKEEGPFEFNMASSGNQFTGWWDYQNMTMVKEYNPAGNWNGNR